MTVHPNAPAWFRRALAVPFHDAEVSVGGASIHYLAWGDEGRRGLVFVHGGGAHAHWWTHVAAAFAAQFRVVAVDLSGHGDSDHRDVYDLEQWTDEVVAAAEDGGIAGRPVVVGHSMGGFVTIATAGVHGDRLSGVIICDSPVARPDPEVESYRLKEALGNPRTYATVDDAVARFRTVPPQEHYLDYVIDHVARRSLREVELPADPVIAGGAGDPAGTAMSARAKSHKHGFQWKFDRRIFEQFAGGMPGIALPYLERVRCRFALLRSEKGLVTPDISASMYEVLGRVAPVIELPEAGHHAMLDQPLLLLTALRTLLADWDHSEPHRPE